MSDLIVRIRSARYIEWILLAVAAAALVLLMTGRPVEQEDAQTDLERRMESVLSCVSGAGKVRVLVNATGGTLSQEGSAAGVLVVAEGAGDLRVALELQNAVQALLGVEAGQIEILPMKEDESP